MGCNTLVEPACRVVGHLIHAGAGSAAGGVLDALAQAIAAGVRWVVVNTATWWLQIPSPDLASEPAIARIQQWLLPITAAVAAGGVIAAGARMTLTRRANPLIDVTGGLLTLAAATTLGVTITTLLLKAGDAWSAWVLQQSTGGHFMLRLELLMGLGGNAASAVVVIFGIMAILLSLVQAILMLFRQAALVILAGVIPLAAAGSIAPMTRAWVRKVTAWMLALICYKPAAAAVYAAAFTMAGSGRGARTTLMGFVLLVLSVLTLPALMKFFTWTTGAIGAPSGGGQLLGAATIGALAVGALRPGGGGSAQDQAHYIGSALGPPGGGGTAGGPGATPPDGSGPSAPRPGPTLSGPGGAGPGGGGPPGAAPGAAPGSFRRPPPWPGPPPAGAGSAGTSASGSTGDGGAAATAADAPVGSPGGAQRETGGASSAGAASTHGAGAASGAAAGAASGAGLAAAMATEAAAGGARLASGAMGEGDQE